MTNKKFKLAAMSLATAVAVSAVGPSASAVTYYLGNGDITVDQDDTRGAFSYQGEDQGDDRPDRWRRQELRRHPTPACRLAQAAEP